MSKRPAIFEEFTAWLISRPRLVKRALAISADALMIIAALWLAFALKFDSLTHGFDRNPWFYFAAVASSLPIFAALGLYRAVVRYISPKAMLAVAAGSVSSALIIAVVALFIARHPFPKSIAVIYGLITLVYVGMSRFLVRWALLGTTPRRQPVIIYGAGEAGAQLAMALSNGHRFRPVAYVDEKRALRGATVHGIRVYAPNALAELVESRHVVSVLLAIPGASRKRKAEVLSQLDSLGVGVQSVPDLEDIISGRARVDDLREVDVADLLGRDAVAPNQGLLDGCIRGKSVMVTGAGGSIGSELCRQILRQSPRRLVLLEMSELALYTLERELQATIEAERSPVELVALLGNAHHKQRVREILQSFNVQTIYHAAAYKHVPIVEQNMVEGVHNNVFSTFYTAEAALECKVETFVLVSTDKAVNPTNVMGATKRLAELVLQGLHERGSGTRFCMVRFGNVLESSGSVVPLFREQIRNGGPVTVTHPEVIRYFMTIPEAAQLVIQAGSMARGGDVFVLDMGQPVKIADLARRMIHLSGLTVRDEQNPDGDIEIRFTGLRPAEKLFEELLIGKNVAGTEHPMILRAMEHALPWAEVESILNELLLVMRRSDCETARQLLQRAVGEYQAADGIADIVWSSRQPPQVSLAAESKVADLVAHRARQGERSTRELN